MWNLNSAQRLSEWKKFRGAISNMDLEEAVQATTHLWSYAPFVGYYLDPANIKVWPDPWQLLDENYYCDIAKSLGMLYTLALSSHGKELDLELRIVADKNNNKSHLVYINQGKYVINYWHDEIVNNTQVEKDGNKVEYCYTAEQLKVYNY
jgi:hypothetical protein